MLSCAVFAMKVPFIDLTRQIKSLRPQIDRVFDTQLKKPEFILGPAVTRFEREFANFCRKKFCVGLNSGTDALTLALKAYGIGTGDEVITVANSFFSTAMAISNTGATVVFVDCDPNYYTMDTSQLQDKITKKTRAIIPVHLYGQTADMDPILALANKYRLAVIEDACQAHGAKYKNRIVPVGETGAFSFYPTKNLGAFGDGGCVVTDNYHLYKRITYLRNNGSLKKYIHTMFGINSRLDSLQAAILTLKLQHLSLENGKRRILASVYTTLLSSIKQITPPNQHEHCHHVYHLYVVECTYRDKLQEYLRSHGINTLIHYPTPLHLQKPYRELGYKHGNFPISEEKSKRILSLPMFPYMSEIEVRYVCQTIATFYRRFH